MLAACPVRAPRRARRGRAPRHSACAAPAAPAAAAAAPPSAPAGPAPPSATLLPPRAVPLAPGVTLLRCATAVGERPRLEPQFGLRRGTSDNAYLFDGPAGGTVLLDLPEDGHAAAFVAALGAALAGRPAPATLVLTGLSPRSAATLAALLEARAAASPRPPPLEVWLSNPAAAAVRALLAAPTDGAAPGGGGSPRLAAAWRSYGGGALAARLRTVRAGDSLPLGGGGSLAFTPVPTPRWPDALAAVARPAGLLFSGPLFGAHVGGGGVADALDEPAGGWDVLAPDWRFYFDAGLAPVAAQARAALDRLGVALEPAVPAPVPAAAAAATAAAAPPAAAAGGPLGALWSALVSPVWPSAQGRGGGGGGGEAARAVAWTSAAAPTSPLAVTTLCPRHGPVVRGCAPQLLLSYGGWLDEQARAALVASVAVVFASAYGNTGALAAAFARGVTRAGAGAELVNAEFAEPGDVAAAVSRSGAFLIGSPTLGGHMPTPVKSALGAILQLPAAARDKPCGVFGSFGWSGEAVDELAGRLTDAGFRLAFPPLRAKFTPTPAVLQAAEEAGTDVAQAALRAARAGRAARARAAADGSAAAASRDPPALAALGRVVGSLCVLSARSGDAESGMVASWVSQASFNPPQLTVAVAKDRAVESLVLPGASFVLTLLAAGAEKGAVKALLRPFAPGEPRFGGLDTRPAPRSGAAVLAAAGSAYLECEVVGRLEAGDHWVLLANVAGGEVLKEDALTAVHHRRSGLNY